MGSENDAVRWKWVAGLAVTALAVVLWQDFISVRADVETIKKAMLQLATKEDINQLRSELFEQTPRQNFQPKVINK